MNTENNKMIESPLILSSTIMITSVFKSIQILLMLSLLLADAVFLGLDWPQVFVAIVGSASGGLTLNYFQKGVDWRDRCLKVIGSTIAGVFIATAFNSYWHIDNPAFAGVAYYLIAFVAFIFLRSVLRVSDANADGIVTMLVRKLTTTDAGETVERTKVVTTKASQKEISRAHERVVQKELDNTGSADVTTTENK